MKLPKQDMPTVAVLSWLVVLTFFCGFNQAAGQDLRDPTLPPADKTLAGARAVGTTLGIDPGSLALIVRSGRPYVLIDRLLYAQGQKVGPVLIERITESEIWLREGGVLRKVIPFSGIQRRTVAPLAAMPNCGPSATAAQPSATVCVKAQP